MIRRLTLAIMLICLVLLAQPGLNVFAGGTTTITGSGTVFPIGNNGGDKYAAQSFQISSGILTQITYTLEASNGTPTGTITWEIQTNNAGSPSGTVLQTGTHSPTASATNTVTVTGGISLASATTYWLVLKPTSAQSLGNFWRWQSSLSSTYANGNASQYSGTWNSFSLEYDLDCSITTTDPTPTPTASNTAVPGTATNTPIPGTPTDTPIPGTPTITLTPSLTFTPSNTPTPTPNLYGYVTLPPTIITATGTPGTPMPAQGRAGAILYTVTVGESVIIAELFSVIALLIFGLFFMLRSSRK